MSRRLPTTHSVQSVAPIVLLGVALVFLLVKDVPPQSKDIVVAIVSGLLGFLSRTSKTGGGEGKP